MISEGGELMTNDRNLEVLERREGVQLVFDSDDEA